MSEQEKKRKRIFLYCIQSKENFLTKKNILRKSESRGLNKKRKVGFLTVLTALATVIKKDPITSIKKKANKLKVHEKTVRIAIKQDLIMLYGAF